jgi:hypothetical protein
MIKDVNIDWKGTSRRVIGAERVYASPECRALYKEGEA